MSKQELITKFINDLPEVMNAFSSIQELCQDVIKAKKLDVQIETDGMSVEEEKEVLELRYNQLKEMQNTINDEIEQRNQCIEGMNKVKDIIKEMDKKNDNFEIIKRIDRMNKNNIDIKVNEVITS